MATSTAPAAQPTPPRPSDHGEPERAGQRPGERRARRREHPLLQRAGATALDLLPALAVYAAVRVAGLLAIALLARSQGVDPWPRLASYDGVWLLGIAQDGYDPLVPDPASGHRGLSNIAFFPLYPMLVGGLSRLTGISLTATGLMVTAIAGLAAAAGLYRLGTRLAGGRTAGLVFVVLWATWPHSIVLSMTYTEALFVALASWSMVALLDRRWLTAGVLCLFAGATRTFGLALAGAVAVAAALAVVRALRDRQPRAAVRPLAAAVVAPLGVLGYWGWLWARTGRPDAWLWVQAEQWKSHADLGQQTLAVFGRVMTQNVPLMLLVNLLVIFAAVVLTVALAVDRAPLPVVVHTALVLAVVLVDAGYHHSKARFLLCAFPLLLLPARALAGLRLPTLVVGLAGVVAVSSWYNAFVLLLWYRSP